MPSDRTLAHLLQWVRLPLVVYTLAALAITWPLASQLGSALIGASLGTTDVVEHVRMVWWVQYALQHGLNPFYQSLFGYPDGFFSAIQWSQPLVYWPPALLGFVTGTTAAVNLWILAILVLNGLAMYWLCLDVLGAPEQDGARSQPQQLAALLGGLIFMSYPALQGHLLWGQINIISNYGAPLFALSLYRIVTGRGTKRMIGVGIVALWVMLLGNYTSALFLAFPLVLFGGGYALLRRGRGVFVIGWRAVRQCMWVLIGTVVLSAPFYVPLILDALDPAHAAYLKTQSAGWVLFSTDTLSFAALSPFTPWTKPIAPAFSYTILNANITEGTAYLGIIALTLALIGLVTDRRRAGVWLVILLGSMLFSLGPLLKWQEQPVVYTLGLDQSRVVLPWALLQGLPLVNLIRTPGRFNLMTGLALGVLSSYGLNALLNAVTRRLTRIPTQRAVRIGLSAALLIGILAEYQLRFPFSTFTNTEPAYFSELAARNDVRAVFDVPYLDTHKEALLEQMAHHKPILAGYYARLTPVDPAKLMLLSETARGLAWQADSATASFPGQPLGTDTIRATLKANGIDVVVYHWRLLDKASTLPWATHVFGAPAYQDADIGVFEVPPPAFHTSGLVMTHSAQYAWPFTAPDDGWWPELPDNTRVVNAQPSALWLRGGARLVVYTPAVTLQHLTLTLNPLFRAHTLSLSVDGMPTRSWTVDHAASTLDFWLALQSGFHNLTFSVSDGCVPIPVPPECLVNGGTVTDSEACVPFEGNRSVCVSAQVTRVQSDVSNVPYHELNLPLAQGLHLTGVWLPANAAPNTDLTIGMAWQAAQKLDGDYHFFVHVLDAKGTLIAQVDGVPGDGAYPTSRWTVPQAWSNVVTLRLPSDTPPGAYKVVTGWYAYPSLARLGGVGTGAADGVIELGTVIIDSQNITR